MISTGLGRKITVVLIVLAVVVVSFFIVRRIGRVRKEEIPPEVLEVHEETRSVNLFFASRDADKLLPETHEVAVEEGLEKQVMAVIAELIKGPKDNGKVSSIPQGTEILQAFWEEDSQTIFLDFNRALVLNHPGGSTGEYFTISMVIRTVGDNFPQVRQVQFLVDGSPVETIAGHYAVNEPIDVLRWR